MNFVSAQYSILFLVFPLSKHYRKLSHRHANWFVQFNWSIHRLQRVEHANEIEAMPPERHRSKGNDWQTFRFEISTNHLTFFLVSFNRYFLPSLFDKFLREEKTSSLILFPFSFLNNSSKYKKKSCLIILII